MLAMEFQQHHRRRHAATIVRQDVFALTHERNIMQLGIPRKQKEDGSPTRRPPLRRPVQLPVGDHRLNVRLPSTSILR